MIDGRAESRDGPELLRHRKGGPALKASENGRAAVGDGEELRATLPPPSPPRVRPEWPFQDDPLRKLSRSELSEYGWRARYGGH